MLERIGSLNPHSMTEHEQRRYIAESANRERGALTGYDCPECLNRGYFNRVDKKGNIWTEQCRCVPIRESQKRIANSGLGNMLDRYTFDTWQIKEPWQRKAKDAAERYAEERQGWFIMAGTPGTGKTHLCTALCGKLLSEGLPVRYVLWRDFATRAKALVNNDAEYQKILDPLNREKVLYIDDLLKTGKNEEPSRADINLALGLLNNRYNDTELLTIISTEWSIEQLLSVDEAVGSRIYERAEKFYLAVDGKENWRLK